MFIKWNDKQNSIGIADIDEQHKQLFLLTNQLFEENQKPVESRKLIPIFKRLYAYTKFHFTCEEDVFRKYGLPEEQNHREQHRVFTNKIREYLEDYREKPNLSLDEPIDFLVHWILNHIKGNDQRYADYYQLQGIEITIHFNDSDEKGGSVKADALKMWAEKKLATELSEIDSQHKELVYILQQLNDLQKGSEKRLKVFLPGIIQKMFYYSQFHFSYEEELMAAHEYPLVLEHREMHAEFIKRVQEFAEEYNLNKQNLNNEMLLFLKNWVTDHILIEDMKYKDTIKQG